jgi:hypothetical protein
MMKKVLLTVGSSAVVVAVLLVWFVLHIEPPDEGAVSCPIYFSGSIGDILPKTHATSQWQVYRYEGEKGTANVKVSVSTTSIPARPNSCKLDISRAPETPSKGADWRIGHIIKPDSLRGKTVRYRVAIKTDREMRLDTGMIYMYDGVKVLGTAIPHLTSEWQTFEVTISVDPAATTFEVWLRLLLDKGTVQPGSGTLYFVPEVVGG